MPLDSPEVTALREQIEFLKLAVYTLAGVVVAVCGFFVAWVRTLIDRFSLLAAAQDERRDKVLERVLDACETLETVVKSYPRQDGH